jgi:hypothetical protein
MVDCLGSFVVQVPCYYSWSSVETLRAAQNRAPFPIDFSKHVHLLHPTFSTKASFRYILSWYQKAQLFLFPFLQHILFAFCWIPLKSLILEQGAQECQECLLHPLNSVALSIRFVFWVAQCDLCLMSYLSGLSPWAHTIVQCAPMRCCHISIAQYSNLNMVDLGTCQIVYSTN